MKKTRIIMTLVMIFLLENLFAQMPIGVTYEKASHTPSMKWICPEIKEKQDLIYSLQNDDYKTYANDVKEKIGLYTNPLSPKEKSIYIQTTLDVENPLFKIENLLNHISNWIKSNKECSNVKTDIDKINKRITISASLSAANHGTFLGVNSIGFTPTIIIQILDNYNLAISINVANYQHNEYNSKNQLVQSYNVNIADVFPFVQKTSYKITYAKAYVGANKQIWNFISNLQKDLNTNFSKDTEMLSQLHYEYSKDSLIAKYGEPTKIISDLTKERDITKEIHFYEKAQKIVFMGKTINFNDVISCDIIDDPQVIPGHTTTYGSGFVFFGFGFTDAHSTTTPSKTIHNYLVKVKTDNLSLPLISIVTGDDGYKAADISSCFNYVIRHKQKNKGLGIKKRISTNKKTKH